MPVTQRRKIYLNEIPKSSPNKKKVVLEEVYKRHESNGRERIQLENILPNTYDSDGSSANSGHPARPPASRGDRNVSLIRKSKADCLPLIPS